MLTAQRWRVGSTLTEDAFPSAPQPFFKFYLYMINLWAIAARYKDDIGQSFLPGVIFTADQDDGGVGAEPSDLMDPHIPA